MGNWEGEAHHVTFRLTGDCSRQSTARPLMSIAMLVTALSVCVTVLLVVLSVSTVIFAVYSGYIGYVHWKYAHLPGPPIDR